jgi:hypothetical protein
LCRYGIDPAVLGAELVRQRNVHAHMVMIASMGDEAEAAVAAMPAGRAHLCLDTNTLPAKFKAIFAEELLG